MYFGRAATASLLTSMPLTSGALVLVNNYCPTDSPPHWMTKDGKTLQLPANTAYVTPMTGRDSKLCHQFQTNIVHQN